MALYGAYLWDLCNDAYINIIIAASRAASRLMTDIAAAEELLRVPIEVELLVLLLLVLLLLVAAQS